MYYKSLNGKWQFKGGEDKVWLDATVPGCNYTDLMDNGIIKDPFEGMNEKDSLWPAEKNYTYKRTFDISESDESGITASYEDGLLKLILPKKQAAVPESRRLEIK